MDESLNNSISKIPVCPADLKEGELRGVKVEGQWLLIVNFKNYYYALDAACSHSGYPLFKGKMDSNGVITCGLHYAMFECQTGAVVSKPAICDSQIKFNITIENGNVYWLKPHCI